jgi:hypothetical protein
MVHRVCLYKEVLNSLDRLAACALIGDWFINTERRARVLPMNQLSEGLQSLE